MGKDTTKTLIEDITNINPLTFRSGGSSDDTLIANIPPPPVTKLVHKGGVAERVERLKLGILDQAEINLKSGYMSTKDLKDLATIVTSLSEKVEVEEQLSFEQLKLKYGI